MASRVITSLLPPLQRTSGARLTLILSVVLVAARCEADTIESPNGRVRVDVDIVDNNDTSMAAYEVYLDGQSVVGKSHISFELEGGDTVGRKVRQLSKPKRSSHDSSWSPVYGERSTIRDHFNELSMNMVDDNSGFNMTLVFRCYDAGIAFRTVLKAPASDSPITISKELSEFRFLADHTAWCTTRSQSPHEALSLSQIQKPAQRPLTIRVDRKLYTAIAEANLVDYAAMMLRCAEDDPHCIVTQLLSCVEAVGELRTPWRVIMLAETPGKLLENNDIVLNLCEPCAIEDTSWIKPGKVIREITLTTEGGKACVDFAANHNFDYVEFDAGWYGKEDSDQSDATTVTVDPKRSTGPLDLPCVIDYAAQHDIGIIVYVNRRALETQLDEILPLYQKWGIKGVKYGFVNTGSQKWTSWLHDAVRKAANHKLMVDIHDEYRPVGYSRTYPNLMSQEGVRGDEAAPESEQAVITLFTRNLAGAADHTICYFDSRVTEHWTHGHQLAKAVCTYSPWQFMFWYDTPLSPPPPGRHNNAMEETPELEFFAKVPTVWDDSRVVAGEIGDFAVIARRSGDDWYIGAMNSGKVREVEVSLDFLDTDKQYDARVYRDDVSVNTPTRIRIEDQVLTAGDRLRIRLAANGGQAVWLTPSRKVAQK